jgi:hypothetical protein
VPATVAEFTTVFNVIATARPTDAEPPSAADPSADDAASAFADDATVTTPPDVTDTPTGIVAVDFVDTRLSATAAATLIGPDDDSAFGVSVAPEPAPPLAAACESAAERSFSTSSVTPLVPWGSSPATSSPLGSSLAAASPAAEAIALVPTAVRPNASNVTAPPASMARSVWAA